jgi:hypothetical protein
VGPRVGLGSGKSRPTGIRSPDGPARSQSLYRLSYLAHNAKGGAQNSESKRLMGKAQKEKFHNVYCTSSHTTA